MKSKEDFSFPKKLRLRGRENFGRLFREGQKKKGQNLLMLYLPQDLPHNRVGICVGKKFGRAVKRNRAKRLIREAYRLLRPSLPTGYDIVFLPRFKASHMPTLSELMICMETLFQELLTERNRASQESP